MKSNKGRKKKKSISARKAYKIMVEVNEGLLSDYLKASLCELKESTWMSLIRNRVKLYSGKLTKERYDMMEEQAVNLFAMIDEEESLLSPTKLDEIDEESHPPSKDN